MTGLLREPDEGAWERWSAPMSLREVEPEIVLQLDRRTPASTRRRRGTTTGRPPEVAA